MWIKKIKNKKVQFMVLGLILAFAAMLLTACLSFSTEVEKFTDQQFSREKNSDLFLYATKGTSDHIKQLLKERPEKTLIETNYGYSLDSYPIYHKNKKASEYISPSYALELSDYKTMPYQMSIASGDSSKQGPAPSEIWIQKVVADSHDIHVGDTFTIPAQDDIPEKELTVSALVIDNTKPVSMTNGAFFYFNKQDLTLFEKKQALEFISITSDANIQELSDFIEENYTSQYYATLKTTLSDLKMKASLMTNLVSKLGTLSALFMFLITIVIILFFIRNTILNEFTAIGTYKAVGFSSGKIMGFYLKAYAIVGIITIVIGSILGLFVSTFIGDIVMEYIGQYTLSKASIPYVIFVILFTSALLLASIYLALRRIKKISPVDALRVGTTSTKAKLKKSVIKNAHSPFSMAINDIFKYKNRSILIVTVVTFSFYIAIFLVNMCYNFDHMEKNSSAWVAFPKCRFYLSNPDSALPDDLLNYVKNSPYVDSYITGNGVFNSTVQISSDDKDLNIKYANIQIYNTYDKKLTGINYANGRPPENANEVALDATTLKNSPYEVGDTITLNINDKPTNFLITGMYHTMMTPCLSFVTDTFAEYEKESYYTSVCVNLKHQSDEKAFIEDYKKTYPSYRYITMDLFVDNIKESVMSIMIPITTIIMGIFFSFTLLNIINIILTNNAEQKQNFGIMKAFGFSNRYIIMRNLLRIMILSSIGMGISAILNSLINAKIFAAILTVDAYTTFLPYTLSLLGVGLVVILLLAYLLSLSIRRISPKQLMED